MNKLFSILTTVMLVFAMSMTAYGRAGSFRSGGFRAVRSYTPKVHVSAPKVHVSAPKARVSTPSVKSTKSSAIIPSVSKPKVTSSTPTPARTASRPKSSVSLPPHKTNHTAGTPVPVPIPIPYHAHTPAPVKEHLYAIYGMNAALATYYVGTTDCSQADKDLWNKTLNEYHEKGKAPEKSEEVKAFEERMEKVKPAFEEHMKAKRAAEAKRLAEERKKFKEAMVTVGKCGGGVLGIGALAFLAIFIKRRKNNE